MLRHQDQHLNLAYSGGTNRNKDSNFNFLPGADDDEAPAGTRRGGDENRNQVRPRNLPLGRDPQSSAASGFSSSLMSPRCRLPCWSPLEPLPEVETGDDGNGRVPPDGAEEWRMEEEEKEKEEEEPDDEWGDSDSGSEFSCRSGGSVSSLKAERGGEAARLGGWDRIGVGEPRSSKPDAGLTGTGDVRQRSVFSHKPRAGIDLEGLAEERNHGDNQSSDSDGEPAELMDAVWTLRDRERFKAQEMEKHQVQLTMYRRLALIRWVRTLQGRVQEQQNRLQSSFDVILTHRKELLRMGAGAAAAAAAAAAQS